MNIKKYNKGFTLTEIMIVLAVIGIISAIVFSVATQSIPDENKIKFKKGNTVLYSTIQTLIESDKYYKDGDLGMKPDGTLINGDHTGDETYFCQTFADVVIAKSKNCSSQDDGYNTSVGMYLEDMTSTKTSRNEEAKEYIDKMCNSYKGAGDEIVTTDDIAYYTVNPAYPFGSVSQADGSKTNIRIFKTENYTYKYFCMKINNELPAFGYGIRADGKIMPGKLAQSWLEKHFNNEAETETVETITAATADFPICDIGYGWDGSACVNCPTGCAECSSATKCTSCESGYKLNSTNCSLCSRYGYYCPGGTASEKKCPLGCSICSSPSDCSQCERGYYLDNGSCLICKSGYYCLGYASSAAIACGSGLISRSGADNEELCMAPLNATVTGYVIGGPGNYGCEYTGIDPCDTYCATETSYGCGNRDSTTDIVSYPNGYDYGEDCTITIQACECYD